MPSRKRTAVSLHWPIGRGGRKCRETLSNVRPVRQDDYWVFWKFPREGWDLERYKCDGSLALDQRDCREALRQNRSRRTYGGLPPRRGFCGERPFGVRARRKFKYGKELSSRGLECESTQEERSTSITKQLVFQYPFCQRFGVLPPH
jgi:hypothetical protein